MARFHFNIFAIPVDYFNDARFALIDFFSERDPKFPYFLGDVFSLQELWFMLRALPDDCTYMVRRLLDGCNTTFSVWLIPTLNSSSAIEHLIKNHFISLDHCKRDVCFNDYKHAINDLPYNSHYIVQRYYE